MADHVHVVTDFAAECNYASATDAMRRFKAYAHANVERRAQWWTRGGSRRALRSDPSLNAAVRYAFNQRGCLALSVDPDWTEVAAQREDNNR